MDIIQDDCRSGVLLPDRHIDVLHRKPFDMAQVEAVGRKHTEHSVLRISPAFLKNNPGRVLCGAFLESTKDFNVHILDGYVLHFVLTDPGNAGRVHTIFMFRFSLGESFAFVHRRLDPADVDASNGPGRHLLL